MGAEGTSPTKLKLYTKPQQTMFSWWKTENLPRLGTTFPTLTTAIQYWKSFLQQLGQKEILSAFRSEKKPSSQKSKMTCYLENMKDSTKKLLVDRLLDRIV